MFKKKLKKEQNEEKRILPVIFGGILICIITYILLIFINFEYIKENETLILIISIGVGLLYILFGKSVKNLNKWIKWIIDAIFSI
jgi:cell division protein FtsW (lipid II flippase)